MSVFTLLTTILLGRRDPEWLGEKLNPLSANFLSPRIGNTNISLFGPIWQWWTLVARMGTGRSVGEAGLAADLVAGKDYVGNDIVWFGDTGDGDCVHGEACRRGDRSDEALAKSWIQEANLVDFINAHR